MLIYFAAPLFSQAEMAFNLELTHELEEQGYKVFLPQRDGVTPNKPPYNEMAGDELCQAIFIAGQVGIFDADVFPFVLDGRVPDEGACVALGIAYGQRQFLERDKRLIGLLTDPVGRMNLLVRNSLR
jgi:nucleoside 2-deoxyribosyltransferase